eukprot:m.194209 g.194209  ORF g.194209 m.194209 type:complete len:421 (-) comp19128_c0_seq1:331-1593(-)
MCDWEFAGDDDAYDDGDVVIDFNFPAFAAGDTVTLPEGTFQYTPCSNFPLPIYAMTARCGWCLRRPCFIPSCPRTPLDRSPGCWLSRSGRAERSIMCEECMGARGRTVFYDPVRGDDTEGTGALERPVRTLVKAQETVVALGQDPSTILVPNMWDNVAHNRWLRMAIQRVCGDHDPTCKMVRCSVAGCVHGDVCTTHGDGVIELGNIPRGSGVNVAEGDRWGWNNRWLRCDANRDWEPGPAWSLKAFTKKFPCERITKLRGMLIALFASIKRGAADGTLPRLPPELLLNVCTFLHLDDVRPDASRALQRCVPTVCAGHYNDCARKSYGVCTQCQNFASFENDLIGDCVSGGFSTYCSKHLTVCRKRVLSIDPDDFDSDKCPNYGGVDDDRVGQVCGMRLCPPCRGTNPRIPHVCGWDMCL